MTTYRVTKDITNTKKVKLLSEGDLVKEISNRGDVMIVEKLKNGVGTGEKFSIRTENLEAK